MATKKVVVNSKTDLASLVQEVRAAAGGDDYELRVVTKRTDENGNVFEVVTTVNKNKYGT